jgi:hypothetical protein
MCFESNLYKGLVRSGLRLLSTDFQSQTGVTFIEKNSLAKGLTRTDIQFDAEALRARTRFVRLSYPDCMRSPHLFRQESSSRSSAGQYVVVPVCDYASDPEDDSPRKPSVSFMASRGITDALRAASEVSAVVVSSKRSTCVRVRMRSRTPPQRTGTC